MICPKCTGEGVGCLDCNGDGEVRACDLCKGPTVHQPRDGRDPEKWYCEPCNYEMVVEYDYDD